jgi:hypothetical protein
MEKNPYGRTYWLGALAIVLLVCVIPAILIRDSKVILPLVWVYMWPALIVWHFVWKRHIRRSTRSKK